MSENKLPKRHLILVGITLIAMLYCLLVVYFNLSGPAEANPLVFCSIFEVIACENQTLMATWISLTVGVTSLMVAMFNPPRAYQDPK